MTLKLDMDGRRVARHSKTVTNADVNQVVADYLDGKITIEQADELAMSWIYAKAARIAKRQGVATGALLAAAWEGWRDALRRYVPAEGNSFTTYGARRIFGEVLDHQRSIMPLPKHRLDIKRKIDKAEAQLVGELHRQPTIQEVSQRTELTPEKIRHTLRCIIDAYHISVGIGDEVNRADEKHKSQGFLAGYAKSYDGRYRADWHHVDDVDSQEIINLIMMECATVHAKAHKALTLRAEGASLKEIGKACGFCETRASQILIKCRKHMMKILPDHGIDMSPERFVQRLQGRHRTSPVRQYSKRA